MSKANGLPARVYIKHSAYYLVTTANKWVRLCSEREGLAAMYRRLADETDPAKKSDVMPAVIGRWLAEKEPGWTEKNAADQRRIAAELSEGFAMFVPAKVTTPVCAAYLKEFAATPRTHNLHRTMLRQVMAYAALEGLREGFNPVDNIQAKPLKKRKRWVTDDDIKALKASALQQSRNGEALAQMIELALLTGQRISDLIKLRWQDVSKEGVYFQQKKTGAKLLVEWSPALSAAIKACERGDRIGFVLRTQSGTGYRYSGIRSAWDRACERAQIEDLHIHDLRGRAGMDKRDADGLEAAKDMLGHTSIAMTEVYVDGKAPKKVRPAR